MKIVLTGATGNLGGLVLRQLLYRRRPDELALSVRNPDRVADEIKRQAVELRYGDYDVPESLEASFGGADVLLFVSSPQRDDEIRLRQHQAAVAAAVKAGVRRIVYTSIVRPDKGRLPLHRLHLATEQAIAASGIPFTILRNAYYMDILRMIGVREAAASGELWSPPGTWTFNTAASEDLAAATAAVLTEGGHDDRVYELTAPRAWTPDELARTIGEVAGRRVVYRTNPDMPSPVYGMLALADMKFVSPDLARLAGRPLRTLKQEVSELLGLP